MQCFRRAMLASILGLGVVAGLVRADGYGPPAYYRNAYGYYPQALLTAPPLQPHPLHRLHRTDAHPACCWAHHNDPGCSSFKSTCNFIFGSCRTFYGEPCRKGPPPFPW